MIDHTEKLIDGDERAYLMARGVLANPAVHSDARIRRSAKFIAEYRGTGSEYRLCCTNRTRGSLHESSMIAGRHEQLGPYYRRSRVESKMNCIKLLGQSLMARDFDRQVAELQVLIAALNGHTALGTPVTEPVGQIRPEKAELRSEPDFCNKAPLED